MPIKKFSTKKQFLIFTISLIIVLSLSISLQSLWAAWTPPTAVPPGNNTPAPINIGSAGQSKDGGLILNHLSGTTNGLIVENGNVGIGTTEPGAKLDVSGGVIRTDIGMFSKRDGSDSIGGGAYFSSQNVAGTTGWLAQNGPSGQFDLWTLSGSTWFNRLRVDAANGNVGIGTTNPGEELEVKSMGGTTQVRITSDSNQYGNLAFSNGSGVTGSIDYNQADQSMAFVVNGTNKLKIIGNGNVGIGTTNPGAKLEISTTSTLNTMRVRDTDYPAIQFWSDNGNVATRNWLIGVGSQAYGDFEFKVSNAKGGDPQSASTIPVIIKSSGNVGIGTTNPGAKLDIAGNNEVFSKWSYKEDNKYHLRLDETTSTNNTAWSFIQSDYVSGFQEFNVLTFNDGNVGIGTAAPGTKLEVNGTTKATGFHTDSTAATVSHDTATTLYTLPNIPASSALFIITASTQGQGASVWGYSAYAIINAMNGGAVIMTQANGSYLFITLSGLNVQVRQISGAVQEIRMKILRIDS